METGFEATWSAVEDVAQPKSSVPIDVSVRRLLGQLFGGVRATSAYNGEGLDVWILDSWVWICSTIPVISSHASSSGLQS